MGDLENKFSIDGFVKLSESEMKSLLTQRAVTVGKDREIIFDELGTGLFLHEKSGTLEGTPPSGFPQIMEPILVPGIHKFMRAAGKHFEYCLVTKYSCDDGDPFWAEMWVKRDDKLLTHHLTYQTEV